MFPSSVLFSLFADECVDLRSDAEGQSYFEPADRASSAHFTHLKLIVVGY